jgi:hypothetical protein
MIEDEHQPPGSDGVRDKAMLLYDYAKHLLSLALLGIGGIASLAQSPLGREVAGPKVALLLGAFAAAGFFALSCSAAILRAHRRDQPVPESAWWCQQGAMASLGIGVGAFMAVWVDALV